MAVKSITGVSMVLTHLSADLASKSLKIGKTIKITA